jgi:2-polyprenyl-3-methyl-5-hydroxy-6-metoxy-1,4-benzoquinol methylase
MDQPGLDRATHHLALDGLRTTNAISRTSQIIWRGILDGKILPTNRQPLRILDIAAGGGDVMIGVAKLAARHGIPIETHGCDINSTAVEYAQQAAQRAAISSARFFQLNALTDSLPEDYDVMMCTLFLHHLENNDIKQLLSRMAKSAYWCVLVDDLCRNRLGYLYAWVGGRLLTRSHIVHTDGPLSVRAAFTIAEFRQLAEDAGLHNARFRRHWPQRFLMSWIKS